MDAKIAATGNIPAVEATNVGMNISSRFSSLPSAVRAAVIAGVVTFLPAVGYVLTQSAAHWLRTLALGAVCALASALCFGVYSRFASAFVQSRTVVRRMRVAAFVDPLEEEELELEARFAEMERREGQLRAGLRRYAGYPASHSSPRSRVSV